MHHQPTTGAETRPKGSSPAPWTHFAPAERLPEESVLDQYRHVCEHMSQAVLDAMPAAVAVLNECRQIVFGNAALLRMVGADSIRDVLGVRPGELVHCVHADEEPGGCGTSRACSHCGAVRAILGAISGKVTDSEASILLHMKGRINALNLAVHGVPCRIGGQGFVVLSLTDHSVAITKEMFETIFYHDLGNALNGIVGAASLISLKFPQGPVKELTDMILERSEVLAREIAGHRVMLAAEKGDLELEISELNPGELITSVVTMFSGSQVAVGKTVMAASGDPAIRIQSDQRILVRVLENMLKNALESSSAGQEVEVGFFHKDDRVVFFVSNPMDMDRDVQQQVFKKRFSTKGPGRGLGTYSIKFLTENFLKGTAYFRSGQGLGTVFYVEVPMAGVEVK